MKMKTHVLCALSVALAGAAAVAADPPERLALLLADVEADRPAPIDCLTPALLVAVQSESAASVERWLRPPELPAPRIWTGAAGLRIHYTLRPDSPDAIPPGEGRSGDPPRAIERLAEALVAGVDLLDGLGFHVSERYPWIDVYVAQTPPGISGFVAPAPLAPGSFQEDRAGFVVLSNRLSDPTVAAAHQLAHLTLLGYSAREPVWWHEATASWVGSRSPAYAGTDAAALAARTALPEDGLDSEDARRLRGNLLFPAFLSLGEEPPTSVERIWERCAALSGDNTLEAIDAVARDTGRGSLADLMRAYYASWVAETAGRSRLASAVGMALPEPRPGAVVTAYPAAGSPERTPIAPLGASFLRFRSTSRAGGLSLRLEGVGDWEPLLLVRSSEGFPFVPVPLAVDEEGDAAIRYPWEEVSDAVLLLLASPSAGPLAPSFAAQARADIPFDLLAFGAEPSPEGILVHWSTDSEADLFGWNVYRGTRPDRVQERINQVPIPAAGGDRAAASYTFVDADAPDRKVYYRLEAVTVQGFSASSHRIGVRPAPR